MDSKEDLVKEAKATVQQKKEDISENLSQFKAKADDALASARAQAAGKAKELRERASQAAEKAKEATSNINVEAMKGHFSEGYNLEKKEEKEGEGSEQSGKGIVGSVVTALGAAAGAAVDRTLQAANYVKETILGAEEAISSTASKAVDLVGEKTSQVIETAKEKVQPVLPDLGTKEEAAKAKEEARERAEAKEGKVVESLKTAAVKGGEMLQQSTGPLKEETKSEQKEEKAEKPTEKAQVEKKEVKTPVSAGAVTKVVKREFEGEIEHEMEGSALPAEDHVITEVEQKTVTSLVPPVELHPGMYPKHEKVQVVEVESVKGLNAIHKKTHTLGVEETE